MSKALPGRSRNFASILVGLIAAMSISTVSLVGPLSAPAHAGLVEETLLLTLANTVRATAGAPALTVDARLTAVAQTWSDSMAAAGNISHNPNLSKQVSGWAALAENVGMGPSIDSIHKALVASPPHYANLTNPRYTHVGMAVTVSGLTLFVTQVFTQQAGVSAPRPPAPTVASTVPSPSKAPAATVPRTVTSAPKASTPTTAAPRASASPGITPQGLGLNLPLRSPSPWVALVYERLRLLDPS